MDMKSGESNLKAAYSLPAAGRAVPEPSERLVLDAAHPSHVATFELLEGSLRHYRLELYDILLGDRLRAHFNVHFLENANPIAVRYDRGELDIYDRQLISFKEEPLAAWNLIQLRAAKHFMDNPSPTGRVVALKTIARFNASPTDFYKLMQGQGMNARPI